MYFCVLLKECEFRMEIVTWIQLGMYYMDSKRKPPRGFNVEILAWIQLLNETKPLHGNKAMASITALGD